MSLSKSQMIRSLFVITKRKHLVKHFTGLSEEYLSSKEPFGQFKAWYEEAKNIKDIKFPGVFCLATATTDGFPSARFVVLTSYDKDGFIFFSNYGSRKASEISENPYVAGSLFWGPLNRSVTFEGQITKLSQDESEKFFYSRPRDAQIAILASNQSTPIESKEHLHQQVATLEVKYANAGKCLPKPDNWGGYLIKPFLVEFWQGKRNSPGGLNAERIRFRNQKMGEAPDGMFLHKGEDGWVYERLNS